MLSRDEYVKLLNKMINKNLPPNMVDKIMKDDQRYGDLLTQIMIADWKGELKSGEGHQSYGYRQLGFKWGIGRIKREFYYHGKYNIYECSSFDSMSNQKDDIDDNNLFYEEFIQDILNSKVLKKKEKQYMVDTFIKLEPIPKKEVDQKRAKANITRGLNKLKDEYKIFKVRGIRSNSAQNPKQELSPNI